MKIENVPQAMNLLRGGGKRVYIVALALVSLIGVAAFLFVPSGDVARAGGRDQERSEKERTDAMLDFALNFGSVSDVVAYGRQVRANALRGPAAETRRGGRRDVKRASSDLDRAMDAIRQLPCAELKESELGGKAFGPGIYCVSDGTLSGSMMLDAGGDQNARFVFRVEGDFRSKAGSGIELANGARAHNVYLVSDGAVNIGTRNEFLGNVVAKGDINVGSDSTVQGKVYSAKGNVDLSNAVAGGGTGFIEICKNRTPGTEDSRLAGRVYTFTIGSQTVTVQVGQCSPLIPVPAGSVTIREELRANSRLEAVRTFDSRFQPINAVTSLNTSTQEVTVTVPESATGTNQVIVDFENTFGAIGVIEICKRAAGPTGPSQGEGIGTDVTGFFEFTVFGIPGQVFSVPVGACTPPIAVNTPLFEGQTTDPFTYVTELGRPGFTLVDIETLQPGRLIAETYGQGVSNTFPQVTLFANPGGGFATVRLVEIPGATLNDPIPAGLQTTINFFNQANPGLLKVCKIAGPGISENVLFRFQVDGTRVADGFNGEADQANGAQPSPGGGIGTPPIGFNTEPFRTFVDVAAGPAGQGGNCNIVDATFVVGTRIFVTELGVSPANTVQISPFSGTAQTVPANTTIFVSRIRCFPFPCSTRLGPVPTPAPPAPPGVDPATTLLPQAILFARAGTVEVEFVDFLFRPTTLKICKTGAAGTFTFTVGPDPNGPAGPLFTGPGTGLFPTVQVQVRSGFCEFVSGPFPPVAGGTPSATNPGTFPVGVQLVITELPTDPATHISGVTTTTGGPGGTVINATNFGTTATATLPGRSVAVTLGGGSPFNPNFVNEVVFNNGPGAGGGTAGPSAGPTTVSGRVLTATGIGISGATIIATGTEGLVYTARTNGFGYYLITGIPSGESYIFTVSARRHEFAPRVVNLGDELSGLDFVSGQ